MGQYREKRREVEARQFTGNENEMLDVVNWVMQQGYSWFDLFTPAPSRGVSIERKTGFMLISDDNGEFMRAGRGDWVVRDPTGRVRPMSDADFNATYDQIS